ncbi:MAG: MBL fold metallo-hydrolase, partial [Gemmatimonadaceae bacterium]|nr:MBL fold metallo-hydrolase [Gemmatimonadaceae bacterium]
MLLKRFYDDNLAQASYLLGCQATGEALVVDPNRDVRQYIEAAGAEKLRITHVTETHIHADFASGSQELARATGAALLLSDCGDADWKYGFAASAGVRLLRDGDRVMIGNLKVDVMHTPGHTPEHIVFIVTDTPATDEPVGVFTGDFVFVGDVGRPDLLEKAAGVTGTMEAGARQLFASIQRFATLPDHLQLWPGHGAGSACGKALGAMPTSTLGYERIANWALRLRDEQAFVDEVLAGQPAPPRYFARMKRINRDGVPELGGLPVPEPRSPADALAAHASGASLLDIRPAAAYAERHVAGAINVPYNRSFVNWAGAVLDYERDAWLIAGESTAAAAARDLAMIGFDRVAGWVEGTEIVDVAGGAVRGLAQVSAA